MNPDAIKSPLSTFNYDLYRDETTRKAVVKIMQLIGENAESIVPTTSTPGEEIDAKFQDLSQKIMEVMIECKVPETDYKYMFESLQSVPYLLSEYIRKHCNAVQKEILSRIIGVRDPGTEKFSFEFSTLSDLFAGLEKARAATGGNIEDYYTIKPKAPETDVPAV